MGWVCFYERLKIIGKFQREAAVRERQQQKRFVAPVIYSEPACNPGKYRSLKK